MKCVACDCLLTDFEATRRHAVHGYFFDLCSPCLASVPVDLETVERFDLFDPELDTIGAEGLASGSEAGPTVLTDPDSGEERDETEM